MAWASALTAAGREVPTTLMMELPSYHWPTCRNQASASWQQVAIFLPTWWVATIRPDHRPVVSRVFRRRRKARQSTHQYNLAGMLGQGWQRFSSRSANWRDQHRPGTGLWFRGRELKRVGHRFALPGGGERRHGAARWRP